MREQSAVPPTEKVLLRSMPPDIEKLPDYRAKYQIDFQLGYVFARDLVSYPSPPCKTCHS